MAFRLSEALRATAGVAKADRAEESASKVGERCTRRPVRYWLYPNRSSPVHHIGGCIAASDCTFLELGYQSIGRTQRQRHDRLSGVATAAGNEDGGTGDPQIRDIVGLAIGVHH